MADPAGISGDELRQVQEYMRREVNTLMRPLRTIVYHYTDGGSAASILEQAKLRATNILFLDDGREMRHTVDFFRQAMELRLRAHPAGVTAELNELILRYLAGVGSTVPPDIWIATLAAAPDSPHQWRPFSDTGHGVALGFSPQGITRAAEVAGALLVPCCYDDDAKISIMSRGLDVLERLYERRGKTILRGADAAEPLVRYVVRELALFGAMMKRSDLSHEDEWRLILCNPSQTSAGARRIQPLAKGDYLSLYIDLDLAEPSGRLPLEDVLIGPSAHQQLTERAFRTLLYKHGYDRAEIAPSHLSLP
jgi:hypothetical protein